MGLKAVANVSGGGTVTGTGTPGKLAKFTGTGTSIGDSLLSESGTAITSAATAETFTNAQTWTLPSDPAALTVGGVLVLNTSQKRLGINCAPGTLLSVSDGIVAAPLYDGIRLGNTSQALFSSSDSVREFYAGLTGGTVVVGSATSHDLLLQRGGVTALTLGASGVASFAGPVRATGTTATAPAFTGSDTDTGIYFPAANQVRISTSGTVALSVDASQNVGIGTASPASALQVRSNSVPGITLDTTLGGGRQYLIAPIRTGVANAGFEIRDVTAGAAVMSFDASQNVGIGTASPTGRLHVVGGTAASGNGTPITLAAQSGFGTGVTNGGDIVLTPGAQNSTGTVGLVDLSGRTGTGIKLPATPGNGDAQALDCYNESTYTATDNSGAGLVYIVNNAAVVTRVGRLVFVRLDITFPGTGSTAYASIAVPFTSIANGGTGASVAGAIGTCLVLANAASLEVYASAPITRQTNANLSGVRLAFFITYQAA